MSDQQSNMMVSISCLTYNHARYVRKTLDGFVMQKTDFPFEVLVHDDASCDGTQEIIREYAERYPDIIKPILQKENQYSQNVSIYKEFQLPRVRGKYLAICEGDDFWCSVDKLQQQVDYMEAHPECYLCVHDTDYIDTNDQPVKGIVNGCRKDMDYSLSQVIEAGGSGLCQTSSYLMRTELMIDLPEALSNPRFSDYTLKIYAAYLGYVHYIGKVMSTYRTNNPESWTAGATLNMATYEKDRRTMVEWFDAVDEYTERKAHKAVEIRKGAEAFAYFRKIHRVLPGIPVGKQLMETAAYLCYRALKLIKVNC